MIEYSFLIGLNDKDKLIQVIDTIEAYKIVNNILVNNGINAYNVVQNRGFFTNSKKEVTIENSFIVSIIDDLKDDTINSIIRDLKVALNQECIGLKKTKIAVNWL